MALINQNPEPNIVEGTDDEYKRTNTQLVKDGGEAPTGKKLVDNRLPKLFKYQFGGQNGYVVIPKGRIVAIDPNVQREAFIDHKLYNMVTLANGGQDVEEPNGDPQADGNYTRAANIPVGVAKQNVYQDLDDSFKGTRPGFVTRANVNVPLFLTKEDAEEMEWGSAYGNDIKPGDFVKSDENGRFVKWEEHKSRTQTFSGDGSQTTFQVDFAIWPGSTIEVQDTDAESSIPVNNKTYPTGEIELDSAPNDADDNVEISFKSVKGDDSRQKIGQVIRKDTNLIPAGWLKWASPEGDYDDVSGFSPEAIDEDGYPYYDSYMDPLANDPYRPTGIPGLSDGSNYVKEYSEDAGDTEPVVVQDINEEFEADDTVNVLIEERYLPIAELMALEIGNDSDGFTDISAGDYSGDASFTLDNEEGTLRVTLGSDVLPGSGDKYDIRLQFKATHQMAGMPTHIDWDNVQGSVDILLQR